MFAMYDDQRIIYREYIQNAYDAIYKAVEEKVLPALKEGVVDVQINAAERRITIRDNGIGIPKSEVAEKLLNIADSCKDGVKSAGQYGIGRLTGAGYCRYLKFKTSAQGENNAVILTFDVVAANQIINDMSDSSSATEVIDAVTHQEIIEEDVSAHYFEVTLEGVNTEYGDLLDTKIIEDYLREVAPIDYSLPFKNTLFEPSVERKANPDFKQLYKEIGHIQVFINGKQPAILKRYGTVIEGTHDEIDSLDLFEVKDDKDRRLAWGWYAVTPFTKAIPSTDLNRGIRLRKHNIQLGTADALNKYFGEARGNNYFYGEVFAIHPNLRPNSDRSGLAPTPETEILFRELRKIFKNLGQLYHEANRAKNVAQKVTRALDNFNQGINDEKQLKADIRLADAELKKLEKKNEQSQVFKRVIELHKHRAEKQKEAVSSKEVLEGRNEQRSTIVREALQVAIRGDIYMPLREKFTEKDILLLRRTFTYMQQACPASNKELLEQLQLHAITQLKIS